MESSKQRLDALKRLTIDWAVQNGSGTALPNEYWNPIQFLCSLDDDDDSVKYLLSEAGSKVDVNSQVKSRASPTATALHIAVCQENARIVQKLIRMKCDVNIEDQWGFTALHYAVVRRNKDLVSLLIANGAAVKSGAAGVDEGAPDIDNRPSKRLNTSSPLDLARVLKFADIEDILSSRVEIESDPMLPQFKKWLLKLGAGEYFTKFVEAGYTFADIKRAGIADSDLECVGVPVTKGGLRRRLKALEGISEFY
jgi:Ankyrin repeats (3 copies)